MAPIVGAYHLLSSQGGRGVLLAGAPGAPRGQVVVIGAGVAGSHAVEESVGLGAAVTVLDVTQPRLDALQAEYGDRVTTVSFNARRCGQGPRRPRTLSSAPFCCPGAPRPRWSPTRWSRRCCRARCSWTSPLTRVAASRTRTNDARRPRLSCCRVAVLLRGEHAGRGWSHGDCRPDRRDLAVCARTCGRRRAGDGSQPCARARAQRRWKNAATRRCSSGTSGAAVLRWRL